MDIPRNDSGNIIVPVNNWVPDAPPFNVPVGGCTKLTNYLPYDEGMFPAKGKAAYSSNAISGTAISAIEKQADDGNIYVFIGDAEKLYRLELNKSITDITKVATTYSSGNNRWDFERYGTWIIATNYADSIQVLKGFTAANYVDLGGSPPKAKYLLLHKGHLILGYLNDGTEYNKKLQWSALESLENYTASLTTGAGSQNLADAQGELRGLSNVGSNFAAFHRESITMGYYSGGNYTFQLVPNAVKNIGAIAGTIIPVGTNVFFWDEKDFYAWDGSSNPEPIGTGVRNTILSQLNLGYTNRITTAHDPRRGLLFWAYPTTASSGNPDRMLCYNYRSRKFTNIEIDTQCIFSMTSTALLLDDMDSIYPSADSVPFLLDSNIWQANSPIMGCVDNTNSKVSTFTGTVMTGTAETGEFTSSDSVIYIDKIKPQVHNSTDDVDVRVGSRYLSNDAVTYSSSATVGANGHADRRASGKYIRVEVTTGLHEGFTGIEVIYPKARGNR